MITLTLVLLVSAAGFRASFDRTTARRARGLALHLCLVTWATVVLEVLTARLGRPELYCVGGVWLASLTVVYAGHALAFKNWGTPLYRPVFLFAFRNARDLAATFPRQTLYAGGALAVAFAAGTFATWADVRAGSLVAAPGMLILAGLAACTLVLLRRAGRLHAGSDPVVLLLLGAPTVDPSLPSLDFVGLDAKSSRIEVTEAFRRATVVVFVVDSLRARSLPLYGYSRPTSPFLTSWIVERGARAVPVAVSPCASTECGIWSLLSSRRYRHLAVNAPSLHDVLRQAGYSVRFYLSGLHRGWMGLELLYGTGHELFVEGVSDIALIGEVAKLPARPRAATGELLYFHLMSVHMSSPVEARFERWLPSRNRFNYLRRESLDARALKEIRNHYDNSVVQADHYIGEICALLAAKGYLDDAIVIITADHGEALGERPGYSAGHAGSLFQESIQVPLVVMDTARKLPEVAQLADLTDVAPTIAHLTGIDCPGSWQGQSVFRSPFRLETHVEFTRHPGSLPKGDRLSMEAVLCLLHGGLYKMVWHRRGTTEVFRAAFNLSSDPQELDPITDEAIMAELEARRGEFVRPASPYQHAERLSAGL